MTEELIGEKKLEAIRDRYIDVMTRSDLRNEISHSDFILTGDDFRCRNGNWTGAFRISYQELDDLITKAKAFIGAFFGLEREARRFWGKRAGKSFHTTLSTKD